ncbi:MAG TPA: hypothetical protein VF452_10395 [Candidatus Binatia bacterium]
MADSARDTDVKVVVITETGKGFFTGGEAFMTNCIAAGAGEILMLASHLRILSEERAAFLFVKSVCPEAIWPNHNRCREKLSVSAK